MASSAQSLQQRPPQVNPPSQDMMGGPLLMAHPCPPQVNPPSPDMMCGPSSMAHPQSIQQWLPHINLPSQDMPAINSWPSTIPAQSQQQIPSQSTTPSQFQSCMQTLMLNVEGVHRAVENYRPGLRMQTDHSNALVRVPSVHAATQAAPYEAYCLIVAYAKPRPGEVIWGEEFSTGVVPRSSRAIHKPTHLRLPPVEPTGTGHIAQPGLGSPAISGQPLTSNSTQPPPLSSVTASHIVDSTCDAFKRDFINNLMVTSNYLKAMAQRTFNKGVEAHSSSSTMDSVNAWVVESQKNELKKLRTILSTGQSIFKDVGRSAVNLALPISEQDKELEHQKVYIDSLCTDFAYLDNPDTHSETLTSSA
ncbi:hypothetical protein BDR07DRAFT_1488093 [Suillus spraguei]|nr:hypothetical protein BDR07DRAFT_1488093 [Suillus spraguei]